MARGNGSQDIVCDDHDRQSFREQGSQRARGQTWFAVSSVAISDRSRFNRGYTTTLTHRVPRRYYHVMARGNGRQDIVCDDHDRQRLMDELARCVNRTSWQVFSFVILSNHLHLVLKTPEPNLARGMRQLPVVVRQRLGATAPLRRSRVPGPIPDRAG